MEYKGLQGKVTIYSGCVYIETASTQAECTFEDINQVDIIEPNKDLPNGLLIITVKSSVYEVCFAASEIKKFRECYNALKTHSKDAGLCEPHINQAAGDTVASSNTDDLLKQLLVSINTIKNIMIFFLCACCIGFLIQFASFMQVADALKKFISFLQ